MMKFKAKPGKISKDADYLEAKYTTEITILYDRGEDLYLLADDEGSTIEKLTPSELEDRTGSQAIHKRFMAAERGPAAKKRAKKAAKKAAKKGGKKRSKGKQPGQSLTEMAFTGFSTKALTRPPGAVDPDYDKGAKLVTFESVAGNATLRKQRPMGTPGVQETGWRYMDKYTPSPAVVWLRKPERGGETWEIMSVDGDTLERLEAGEAMELGVPVTQKQRKDWEKYLRERDAPRKPLTKKKKTLMQRLFG